MKLSVETSALRQKFNDVKAIELIKEAGFDCIDYSFYWTDADKEMLHDNYIEYANTLKKILNGNNISCNQAHAPFEFSYNNKMDITDEKYKKMVRSLEFASILGAENIVIHTVRVPDGVDFTEYNLNYYKSFEPYCEKFNIHIAVENLFTEYDEKLGHRIGILETPELLSDFISRLQSPWYVACIDLGHSSITGTEPEYFISKMDKNILKALHVQDNDYRDDKHFIPYLGKINWDNVTQALAEIGYDGDLTLEVFEYFRGFDNELIPHALKLAAETGKHLIKKFESYR